ncbi:MAG TPA: hypothetical protein VIV40_34050 [Kofleriaceae bacterium]
MLIALGGCAFAQKHPGVSIGIVAGTIGFGACELSVEKIGTCSAIGGAAGLVLGGITGLVTMFADTNEHELNLGDDEEDSYRVRNGTPPPPGLPIDAGIEPGPANPLPAPTSTVDAGVIVDGGFAMDAGVR